MKREYQILAISLVIIVLSGGMVYLLMNPGASEKPHQHDEMTGAESQGSMPMSAETAQAQMRKQIEGMEESLKSDPQNYELLVGLGNAYYDINEASKAIVYYERALKIRPKDPGVIVDLGAMYHQLGNADKAIELFNSALVLDPALPQAYFNLGMVKRMAKNDPVGAAKAWQKYLELDPNSQARSYLEEEIKKALGEG